MAAFVQVDVDVIYINMCVVWSPVVPVRWVVSPVVRRVPSVVARSPEEGENWRNVNVNRFNNVVRTVNVRVADYLYRMSALVFTFYYNGCHVLEHIITYHGLQYYQMRISFGRFDYAKVIYLSVAVEVKVVDSRVIIIESSFKFFQITRVGK